MKVLIAVLALLFGSSAIAADLPARPAVFESPDVAAVITDAPCTDKEVLQYIKPEYQSKFRAGAAVWQGMPLSICWVSEEDIGSPASDNVFIIDNTGDMGRVPKVRFNSEI